MFGLFSYIGNFTVHLHQTIKTNVMVMIEKFDISAPGIAEMKKVYRYDPKDRKHRHFNNLGREKNPNGLRFYASNMKYADKYRYIHMDCGRFGMSVNCKLRMLISPLYSI